LYLAILLAANLALLLPPASPLRITGALILIGLLPGLSWAGRWLADSSLLLRCTVGAALSYVLTILTGLLLHYLPGPAPFWPLLVILDGAALLPLAINKPAADRAVSAGGASLFQLLAAGLIIGLTLFLRTANLHYSEFQGDEALVMISAAEALTGHEDALLLRSKGPGELLLPLVLWRLTGAISELIARLPFAGAALFAVVSIYLIGQAIGGSRAGWLGAIFFASNGFMVAFARIVQYQILVVWLSALAFLMIVHWYQTGRSRFASLAGLFLGTGLLAHYDAILILPALLWFFLANWRRQAGSTRPHPAQPSSTSPLPPNPPPGRETSLWTSTLKPASLFLIALLLVTLPFYLPFALDPRANRTGEYVGGRIGDELRNNLPEFFHFNIFYSSSYYLILTGGLVLVLLIWFVWRAHWSRWWIVALPVIGAVGVVINPTLLAGASPDLSVLPFLLLLLGAFFSFSLTGPASDLGRQALVAWFAVPFLGYNFVVALGLTHIYTIVPAWSLLAGLAWYYFFDAPDRPRSMRQPPWVSNSLLGGWLVLSVVFLWNAFVRHDVEYLQDYPAGNLSLYWTPYEQPPQAGFFGFAHRSGWKAVGRLVAGGTLSGDYRSNEEPDVTTWYTRGAPRACDEKPEFYFLASDRVDAIETPTSIIDAGYDEIGRLTLPNGKRMRLMQQLPTNLTLGELDEAVLAREFDRMATPAAFARSARSSRPVDANFGHLVRLIGYDLDTRRAYPGGRLPVTLYWQARQPVPTGYQVFTHLESENGPVAQADGVPVCWSYPTDAWRPGQIIADQHAMLLSPDLAPGHYPLEIGLYLADTFERLDLLDEAGQPAGTSLRLTTVEIKETNPDIAKANHGRLAAHPGSPPDRPRRCLCSLDLARERGLAANRARSGRVCEVFARYSHRPDPGRAARLFAAPIFGDAGPAPCCRK
jgi:hypothetical protein